MSSSRKYLTKRREKEQCLVKKKYYDEDSAWAAARGTGITARVYRCPGLKGEQKHYHVTGGPKWWERVEE